ncbi:MAG: hypothetical protein ABIO06_08625, partial [Pseudolysinimonas sp.]
GRALNELAHALEFLKGDFAVDAELVCDLVHAWVGHKFSCLGSAQAGQTLRVEAHFELLISCHSFGVSTVPFSLFSRSM